jgi:dipeptidyl-peptidase 4
LRTTYIYAQTDESRIPELLITHPGKEDPHHTETHRYPFAGKENPLVSLFVAHLGKTTTTASADGNGTAAAVQVLSVACDLLVDPSDTRFHTDGANIAACSTKQEVYIARVGWWPDRSLMVQVQNRMQNVLQLLRVDACTGASTVLLEETSEYWVNLHDMLHVLPASYRPPSCRTSSAAGAAAASFYFIWCSECRGFKQLYVYAYNNATAAASAAANNNNCCAINLSGVYPIGGGGQFVVDSIDGVDADRNIVYFSGNCDAPTEKHLFAAHILPPMRDNACDLLQVRATII